jgi:hypothetical protein
MRASPLPAHGSIPRGWIEGSNQPGPDAHWFLPQNLVPILRRARSADSAEHSRKVLLRFESARHGDIKNPHLARAQHLLRTLYPLAQYKLARALACRQLRNPSQAGGLVPLGTSAPKGAGLHNDQPVRRQAPAPRSPETISRLETRLSFPHSLGRRSAVRHGEPPRVSAGSPAGPQVRLLQQRQG